MGWGLGAGVGKDKNELVVDTTSCVPGQRQEAGQRQKRISVRHFSFLPGGVGYRGHFGSRYTLCLAKNVEKNRGMGFLYRDFTV